MTEAPRWTEQACKDAASLGLIQALEEQRHLKAVNEWDHSIWKAAAVAGQVDVLRLGLAASSSTQHELSAVPHCCCGKWPR